MKLDPKGRKAARLWAIEAASDGGVPGDDYIDGILTAYISTITPAEVGGLVERLRGIPVKWIDLRMGEEAADAIEALTAALASERAAHAETKLERDEAKTKSNYWQAEYLNACRDASSFSDDLLAAESQLDEALKALEETDRILRDIERHETTRVVDAQDRISAARRVCEGGKADG